MDDQLSTLLLYTAICVGSLLLWLGTVGIAYWDTSRRELGRAEQIAWLALVGVVPGIGFLAYLFSRLLGAALSPCPPRRSRKPVRETMVKPPAEIPDHLGTIPAVDLVKKTRVELESKPAGERPESPRRQVIVLEVAEGPHAGRRFVLRQLPALIGRSADAAVLLDQDQGASRRHAEIYEQNEVLRIRDLRSTHGTLVNGYGVDDKALDPGDRIQVGLTTLIVKQE